MVKKIDLSISTKYVPDWTYLEAVRELLQNAKDRQIENKNATMCVYYNKDTQSLAIENAHTSLEIESILIGCSTKQHNDNTIGQHGEGYKLALMVLAREQKKVIIKNMFYGQEWTCRLVKSRTFNDFEIPSIFIENKEYENDSLVIEVHGITEDMYNQIVAHTLFLQEDIGQVINTPHGDILLDLRYKGLTFVEGLYIGKVSDINYGYNFNANQVKLDRDRRLISSFDLSWNTSAMWSYTKNVNILFDLLNKNSFEVRYINNFLGERTARKLFSRYDQEYGHKKDDKEKQETELKEDFKATESKIYLVTPDKLNVVADSAKASGRIAVACPEQFIETVQKAMPEYVSKLDCDEVTAKEKLQKLFEDICVKLTNDECQRFEDIIELL